MQALQDFKIEKSQTSEKGTISHLVSSENINVAEVPGCVLESLFKLENNYYLAFLTEDSPFEECLYIVLLDSQYRLLDRVDIFQDYASGILSNVEVQGSFELTFDFLEKRAFRLLVAQLPEYRLKRIFSSDPIHYSNRLGKAYLTVCLLK